jgi:hypothetical protein
VYLNELYYFFEIRPWTKSVARSLKKEPKIYLYDWTEAEDPGSRYENMVAVHLLKACDYWTDTGHGNFQLYYLRNKEKQEIDFLVVKNRKPWLAVEAKYSDKAIQHKEVNQLLKGFDCKFVQVVYEDSIYRNHEEKLIMSANQFLAGLP